MRLRISRPSWSVPIQCSAEGGFRRLESTCLRGSAGASRGANSALKASRATSTRPATVSGLRRQTGRRARAGMTAVSAIADPRVEPVIAHVHYQVDDRVDERGEQCYPHHGREVEVDGRVGGITSQTRPAKN